MSGFVIDEAKVEELLRANAPSYVVSIAPSGIAIENRKSPYYSVTGAAGGTVTIDPVAPSIEARARLAAVRKRIENSGITLHGEKELSEEIERMRSL
jgi:hypothetical protein